MPRNHRLSDTTKAAIILRDVVTYRRADWAALAAVIPALDGRPLAAHQREDFEAAARTAMESLGQETLILCGYLPRP